MLELGGAGLNVSSRGESDLTPLQTAVLPLLHMSRVLSLTILGGFNDASILLLTQNEFETVVTSRVSDRLYKRNTVTYLLL